jgi:hypothetical protein
LAENLKVTWDGRRFTPAFFPRVVDRPVEAYSREKYRAAVFGGVYQHLNSKPPLRTIVL